MYKDEHVYVCACVCDFAYVSFFCLTYWETELESGVSPRDVGFWCFPDQRSGTSTDEDVMSSSAAPISCYSFVALFLPLSIFPSLLSLYSICLSCICLSVSLPVFISPLSHCRGVGVHWLLFFFLFFYEWDALFTLWQSYFCQRWWWTHTVWPH